MEIGQDNWYIDGWNGKNQISGATVGKLPVPTREGYTFEGWLDAEGKLVTADAVVDFAADAEFTACWKKIPVPVDPEQPVTGDNFAFVAVITTMMVAAAGLFLVLVNRRKFFNK